MWGIINYFLSVVFGKPETFPGSTFTPLAAAFATQGYWVHADIIHLIGATQFQHFAVFIYMIAIIGAIISTGLGSPPKQYLWFIMGPAVFHFLIATTMPVTGVAWRVAGIEQDGTEVWKLAEVGLANTSIAQRLKLEPHAYSKPTGGEHNNGTVDVSYVFAQLDGVVSDSIQNMILWLGVYNITGSADSINSNRIPLPTGAANLSVQDQSRWYLLSNLKWGFLDTITAARVGTPEVRDAFVTFMASRCGDKLQDSIDPTSYAKANQSNNGIIPPGIFKGVDKTSFTDPVKAYEILDTNMNPESVPIPISLRRLLQTPVSATGTPGTPDPASFYSTFDSYKFANYTDAKAQPATDGDLATIMNLGQISCRNYIDIVVRAFRWEAAQVYLQLKKEMPLAVQNQDIFDYSMLYGWKIRVIPDDKLFATDDVEKYKKVVSGEGENIKTEQQGDYIRDLIFINMMKNEFLLAPNLAQRRLRTSSSQDASANVEQYQKTIGSRNKYGEVYSWAMMMPYMQGMLLYLLAIGYPFACMFVLIPGWHKIMFTWASFWIWAKIWDVGFAIATVLERSVWATLGNSTKASLMNPYVVQMLKWGTSSIAKTTDIITLADSAVGKADHQYTSYLFLDRAMTLFHNMDLDLQNSYYIYIMAALYFAVPAVTGQLVLGAKAGVAGLATNAFTSMAQETGAKAGAGLTADWQKRTDQAQAATNQSLRAKAMQDHRADANGRPIGAGAIMSGAFDAQFQGTMGQFNAATKKEAQAGIQAINSMTGAALQQDKANMRADLAIAGLVANKQALSGNPLMQYMQREWGARATQRGANRFDWGAGAGLSTQGGDLSVMAGSLGDIKNFDPSVKPPGTGVTGRGVGGNGGGHGGGGYVPIKGGYSGGGGSSQPIMAGQVKEAANFLGTLITGEYRGMSELNDAFGSQTYDSIGAQASRQATASSSDLSIQGWGASRDAERQGIIADRMKSYGQGALQDAVYYDNAAYTQGMAPTLAAMGVSVQGPGPKSDDYMYMAMSGMGGSFGSASTMGADGKPVDTVNFMSDKGYLDTQIKDTQVRLDGSFGSGALNEIYGQYEQKPGQAGAMAFGRTQAVVGEMAGAGGSVEGQLKAGFYAVGQTQTQFQGLGQAQNNFVHPFASPTPPASSPASGGGSPAPTGSPPVYGPPAPPRSTPPAPPGKKGP